MYADSTPTRSATLFESLAAWLDRAVTITRATEDASETDRDRRDFVLGKMEDHPHAFASEADVQCMMHLFPGRF